MLWWNQFTAPFVLIGTQFCSIYFDQCPYNVEKLLVLLLSNCRDWEENENYSVLVNENNLQRRLCLEESGKTLNRYSLPIVTIFGSLKYK